MRGLLWRTTGGLATAGMQANRCAAVRTKFLLLDFFHVRVPVQFGNTVPDGVGAHSVATAGTFDGPVYAIAVADNGLIYAGGEFTGKVMKWDFTSWTTLGSGPSGGINVGVYALTAKGNEVYVG